ncbi:MAG: hypothetical protein PVH00_11390 [Gemmatimonadota bacterium]
MTRILARHRPEAFFVLAVLAVHAAGLFAVASPRAGTAVPTAVSIDLTLFVPALWYYFLVHRRGLPWVTVVPVFLLSLVAAPLVLPAGDRGALPLIGWLAVPAELLLLGLVIRQIARARRTARAVDDPDVLTRIRAAARAALGSERAADIVAYEFAVLWYALGSWRVAPPRTDETTFSYHRKTAYASIVIALLLAIAAEAVPVHLLLSRLSVKVAWVVTVLGIYGALWLIGDYRALRLRPVRLDRDALRLRLGLRWSLDVPLAFVRSTRQAGGSADAGESDLWLALRGSKTVRVEFTEPVEASGIYGRRKTVRAAEVGADEPARLAAALERAISHTTNDGVNES